MADPEKMSDEDEQAFTMQKITDFLIAAGYFRARIQGLDPFDKIVGGMSWAITASGVPVDIKVQFRENANIGEKITISENIVRALVQMKCPYHIKPHQIQGIKLNCKPLFSVVQWLVKSVIDYRRITGDTVRNYSKFLFDVDFHSTIFDKVANDNGREYFEKMNDNYQLKRIYRKQQNTQFKTEQSLVDATLLEYGYKFRAASIFGANNENADAIQSPTDKGSNEQDGNKKSQLKDKYKNLISGLEGQKKATKDKPKDNAKDNANAGPNLETEEEEQKRLEELEKTLKADESKIITGSKLINVIDTEQLKKTTQDTYEEDQADGAQALNLKKNDKELTHQKQKEKLVKRLEDMDKEKQQYIEEYKASKSKLEEIDTKLEAPTKQPTGTSSQ